MSIIQYFTLMALEVRVYIDDIVINGSKKFNWYQNGVVERLDYRISCVSDIPIQNSIINHTQVATNLLGLVVDLFLVLYRLLHWTMKWIVNAFIL